MVKLTTKPAQGTFLSSVLGGLVAGVVTAVASVVVLGLVAVAFGRHGSLAMAPAMVIGALPLVSMILIVALGLALFPIGPLWVLTAWLLHRS